MLCYNWVTNTQHTERERERVREHMHSFMNTLQWMLKKCSQICSFFFSLFIFLLNCNKASNGLYGVVKHNHGNPDAYLWNIDVVACFFFRFCKSIPESRKYILNFASLKTIQYRLLFPYMLTPPKRNNKIERRRKNKKIIQKRNSNCILLCMKHFTT